MIQKPLENIFSQSKSVPKLLKCPNQNIPIIIDIREKQSLIASSLFNKKANLKFESLNIGDYLISDIIIERKTFQDFVNSILDKRIIQQLINLKKYPKFFLIIENFSYNYKDFKIHENAIRGMLLSVAIDFQIPIIFSKNEEDTANFLLLTAKKSEKPERDFSTRPLKVAKTLNEQKQFILEGFPGVGPATAKSLIKNFQNLTAVFNADGNSLSQIPKFDNKKIKKFREILEK